MKSLPDTGLASHLMLAISGKGFGAEIEPTPAADATAWALVALMAFCVGCFALGAFVLIRRARRSNLELTSSGKDGTNDKSSSPDWQRPADWWKQQ